MKNILIIILVSVGIGQNIGATDAVENVLDNLHLYASEANGKNILICLLKTLFSLVRI